MISLKKLRVLIDKDLGEHFRSKRVYASMVLMAIIGIISIYSALTGISSQDSSNGLYFLQVFSSSGGNLPSFASLITFLLPLVSIILGFDAINSERAKGTLSRLMAQPIYRDSILLAKFMAGMRVLAMMIMMLFAMVTAAVIMITGLPPTFEELIRLLIYMVMTILFSGIWYSLAVCLSVMTKQATVSAISGMALWILVTFFVNLIYSGIASAVYPVAMTMDSNQIIAHQKLLSALEMTSPVNLYSGSISAILNPEVRSLGLIFYEQLQGAIAGKLPIGESVMVVLPQILLMCGFIYGFFLLAYMKFVRQDIRTS